MTIPMYVYPAVYLFGLVVVAFAGGLTKSMDEYPADLPPWWAVAFAWPLVAAVAFVSAVGLVGRWAFDLLFRNPPPK